MQQLFQIVKAHLQQLPHSDHPDADILTAFAERSLPSLERSVVMEHLARCGECREVLALALPEIEEVVTPVSVWRPWLSMPALRWGAIAATLIVVVWAGIVRYRQGQGTSPTTTALLQVPREVTVNTSQPAVRATGAQAPPDSGVPIASRNMIARTNTTREQKTNSQALKSIPGTQGALLLAAPLPAPAAGALNLAPRHSAAGENLFAPSSHPSSPVPAQTETVEVAGAAALVSTEQSQVQFQRPSEQESFEDRAVIGKAKALVAPQATGSPATAGQSIADFPVTAAAPISTPSPRWTITSAGGLQRSYDQGKTWQDISVTAASGLASAALQAEPSTGYARRAALSKKQSPASSPLIRAISASGTEVWAGASGGILYHSVDGGDHWVSTIPSDVGILLTGDIVSIEFPDSVHGKLLTSTSESWTTADGGQHWSRQ